MSHIHEKIDFTVEVLIVHKDKVLLRMHDKVKKWLGPGGHVELDEDPVEAAIREVKEEVGLDVELVGGQRIGNGSGDILPPVALNRHHITPTHEHVSLVYFATSKSDSLHPMNESDRSDECRWCTLEDLEKMDLLPNTRQYATAALLRLGASAA
ncbi:MAG: NUDIX domain-containing protein [bacterium]|nr:NUDIX domain-containing protein [bacterium]